MKIKCNEEKHNQVQHNEVLFLGPIERGEAIEEEDSLHEVEASQLQPDRLEENMPIDQITAMGTTPIGRTIKKTTTNKKMKGL